MWTDALMLSMHHCDFNAVTTATWSSCIVHAALLSVKCTAARDSRVSVCLPWWRATRTSGALHHFDVQFACNGKLLLSTTARLCAQVHHEAFWRCQALFRHLCHDTACFGNVLHGVNGSCASLGSAALETCESRMIYFRDDERSLIPVATVS